MLCARLTRVSFAIGAKVKLPCLGLKAAAFAPSWPGQNSLRRLMRAELTLRDFVDVVGASGVIYRFMRLREGHPLSPMGGNYIYTRFEGDGFEMIYAGEVGNLMREARSRWVEAERQGADQIFTRLNISERVRQLELADIVDANQPSMNVGQAL